MFSILKPYLVQPSGVLFCITIFSVWFTAFLARHCSTPYVVAGVITTAMFMIVTIVLAMTEYEYY